MIRSIKSLIPAFSLLLILTASSAVSQVYTWDSVTFLGEIKDAVYHDGKIWSATGGGLFSLNVDDKSFNIYNKLW